MLSAYGLANGESETSPYVPPLADGDRFRAASLFVNGWNRLIEW